MKDRFDVHGIKADGGAKPDLCVIGDAGGAHVRHRVRAMRDAGVRIELLTPRPSGLDGVCETVVENDGAGDIFRNWSHAIAASKAPVVNIHYASSHGAWVFALSGDARPMILNVMGGDVLPDEQSRPHAIARRMTRNVLCRADVVTAKSKFLAEAARIEGARAEAIEILFWGIDREIFKPCQRDRDYFGLPANAFVVLSPRPLKAFYRADIIVDACAQLIVSGADVFLLLCRYEADDRFEALCREKADSLGFADRLRVLPPLDGGGMAAAYNAADVAVGLPPSDAFPQTALEAMACGCINVLAPLDRYEEFVKDGTSVCFSEPEPNALAEKLNLLAFDPDLRARLAEGGRQALSVLPDLDQSARCMIRIVQRLRETNFVTKLRMIDRLAGRLALALLSMRAGRS